MSVGMSLSLAAGQGTRRAPTRDFLAYEDDDEDDGNFPVKHSTAIHGGMYEEDRNQERFRKDFAQAEEIQKAKNNQLGELKANGTLSEELKIKRRSAINADFKEKCREFVHQRAERWGDKTSVAAGARNFLHHLAYESCSSTYYPQWLVYMASTTQPHLMGSVDGKGRTPLTAAIAEANFYFCYQAVIRLNDDQAKALSEYLQYECKAGRDFDHDREATCLHAALSAKFYERHLMDRRAFITRIISFVPKAMFKVKDLRGRTPLHLAVQYENCSPSQQTIVEKLLIDGPEALEIESQELGRNISIFQFHELSKRRERESYERKRKALVEAQGNRPVIEQKGHEREQMSQSRMTESSEFATATKDKEAKLGTDRKNDPKKPESKQKKGLMEPPPNPSERTSRPDANVAIRRLSIASDTPKTREASPKPWSSERRAMDLSQVAAPPVSKAQKPSEAESCAARLAALEQEEETRKKAAAAISEQLKLICLRNNDPDKASQFLRGLDGRQDKALWFDFGPPQKLNMKDFQKRFEHFRFESILQYVAFPHIDLVTKANGHDDERSLSDTDTSPMVVLFRWLQEKKRGVTRIIRVIVDDLEYPSHTDEAIEKALTNFEVEILDWRRADLCPASLAKVGSHLREITLYWSGSNTVLRGWSEPEGLAQLTNLKTINIVELNRNETEERVKKNLEEFEIRLHKSWPKGKAKPKVNQQLENAGRLGSSSQWDHQHALQGAANDGHDQKINPHRWLDCMKKFTNEFRRIKEVVQGPGGADSALSPVVVALIDDGTNIDHPDLSLQKSFNGHSFYVYKEKSGARVDPWWHSESGHGTLMARLIAGVCPSAIIHVIKLHTGYAQGSKKLQIDPKSAIRAIEYATELGAQIISMSWTIKPPEGPAKGQFVQAVNSAMVDSKGDPKGILMFCAASDQGNFAERTFPHTINPNIFRIGAAAATGKIMDTVGDQQSLSFILPGHEVVIDHWYDDIGDKAFDKFEAHSGSSVATALATGLAALIIECVRLGVMHTNTSPPEQQHDSSFAIRMGDLQKIREHETMKKALSSIDRDNNTNHLYLKVWDLFEKKADKLKAARLAGENHEQLEIIAGLARHFLRKGAS